MPVIVVIAEERSALLPNAPTATAITAAFRRARLAEGDWIGPAPRITRTAVIGERFGTRATWIYGWPAGGPWDTRSPSGSLRDELVRRVTSELARAAAGWQPVLTAPWSAPVNGPLAWWASGEASVTRTRDQFPTGTGRLDADEDPLGPTTAADHPTSPGETVPTLRAIGDDLVAVGATLGGLYLLVKLLDD